MMLVYLFNKYIHYFYFRDFLPADLFRRPYKDLTSIEVNIWVFMLTWVIPGVFVGLFMRGTNFVLRVKRNWGVNLVCVVVFINIFFAFVKYPLFYLTSQIEGGGATYVVFSYMAIFQSYLKFPLGLALLLGTVKIFLTLQPSRITR